MRTAAAPAYEAMQRLRAIATLGVAQEVGGFKSAYSLDAGLHQLRPRQIGGTTTTGLASRYLSGETTISPKVEVLLGGLSSRAASVFSDWFWLGIDRKGKFNASLMFKSPLEERGRAFRSFKHAYYRDGTCTLLPLIWSEPARHLQNPDLRDGIERWLFSTAGLDSLRILLADRLSVYPRSDGSVGRVAELLPMAIAFAGTAPGLGFVAPLVFAILRRVVLDELRIEGRRLELESFDFDEAHALFKGCSGSPSILAASPFVVPSWTSKPTGKSRWPSGQSPSERLARSERKIHSRFSTLLEQALGPLW